jgi:release factor glutamine methyltransferase
LISGVSTVFFARVPRAFRAVVDAFGAALAPFVRSVGVGTTRVYEPTRYHGRPMRARKLIKTAVAELKASEAIDHWQRGRERIEAEDLLAFVMDGDEPDPDDRIGDAERDAFLGLVARRATGEPVPYIKGFTEFRGLELISEPGVFVPRDSSEYLAEQAVKRLRGRRSPVLVDLATGAGTIALSVANEVPKATVYGTDLSEDAVDLARRNARRLGLKVRFAAGDVFGGLPKTIAGAVDVITVHPPYVAMDEVDDLPDEIKDWEPVHTLTDRSGDGLGFVRQTVAEAPAWLRPKGWLLMETDPDRARDVKKVMEDGGFRDVRSTKGGDLKITRVIVGRRPA